MYQRMASPSAASTDTQFHLYIFTLTLLGDIPVGHVQGMGLCQARRRKKGGFLGLLVPFSWGQLQLLCLLWDETSAVTNIYMS